MPSRTYTTDFEVRGYELDSFGHVNHAVYISWMEHARWKMLEQDQVTLKDFDTWKRWPIIAHVEGTFLKPTYMNQKILSRAHVTEHGKTHFTVEAEFTVEDKPVFRGKARVVMINEKGRPDTIPPQMIERWAYTEAKAES